MKLFVGALVSKTRSEFLLGVEPRLWE
jgi:hypothetical protein